MMPACFPRRALAQLHPQLLCHQAQGSPPALSLLPMPNLVAVSRPPHKGLPHTGGCPALACKAAPAVQTPLHQDMAQHRQTHQAL